MRAVWSLNDDESGIEEVLWAIGTTPFSQQLQPYTSVGRYNAAVNSQVALPHNASIFVSIVARNGVGLVERFTSNEVRIDHTPPFFGFLREGNGDNDVLFSSSAIMSASWE